MKYIRLGTIVKTFGLQGQLRCKSMTSFASSRFHLGTKLTLLNEKTEERKEVIVSYFRDSGDYYFLAFKGLEDINAVEGFLGFHIEIPEDEAPLPEGFYRLSDLIGCHVLNAETGELIGEVIDVLTFSSSSNFKIKETNGKTCYIPFVMKEFIETLDIEKKEITVHVIPGLL